MIEIESSRLVRVVNTLSDLASDNTAVAGARLCAAIYYKGGIVATGANQNKTHPFQMRFGKNSKAIYLHAEVDAIKNALRELEVEDLKKTALIIARIKADNSLALAKPCVGCIRAIATFDIPLVYFTTDEGNIGVL